MFRKLREALKKQRYRVHSDDVALPEVHTGLGRIVDVAYREMLK